jgi:hypothetical protein
LNGAQVARLPFNFVVNSAITAFVLDVVEAKFVVVVSKRFKVAEPFHWVTL